MSVYPLRKILSIQFILISVLPFIIMSVLGFIWILPVFKSDMKTHQLQLATTIASQMESHLTATKIILKGISNILKVPMKRSHYQEVLDAQLAASDFINSIYITGSDGKITMVSLKNHNLLQQKDLLRLDLSRNTLFQDVKKKDQPLWSDTFLSVVGGGMSVAHAVPVKEKIIFGEINLRLLTEYLKRISTVEKQLIFILDRRGQVIADQGGLYTAQQLNLKNLVLVRQGMEESVPHVDNFKFNGSMVMGSLVKISLLDWYVLIMIPKDVVNRPIWTTISISLSAFLVTFSVGGLLAITFARRLARRFERLAEHTRSVAERGYTTEWPKANITEFRELSNSLRHMADTIREREKYNRILFADSPIPLVVIEPETASIMDCNDAALRLYGFKTLKEFTGKTILDFSARVQEDDIESDKAAIKYRQLCLKRGYISFEWWHQRSDGEIWYSEINLTQFHHGDKTLMQYSVKDITEQKQAAEELEKLEEQLKQAQKMESIGTLAGGIAHDFNNILFPMLGYTEMMISDIQEGSLIRESLDEVLKGILRARDLVKQILEFSRQADHEYIPVDCDVILHEVLKLSRSTLPTTIELKQDIQENCGKVEADPTQVHQILMNLITNAFHSMEENGGLLTVTLKVQNPPPKGILQEKNLHKSYVCITVTDTGTGMNDKTIKRIFDPYFTTKQQGKGTGLGLSVVHGIVKTYYGHIDIKSNPGKGTEIKIYLPRIQRVENEIIIANRPVAEKLGNERILLVDDEESILKMFRKMLESLGYHIYSTLDSRHALDVFSDQPGEYDLVITDMTMPGFTGDKLAVELKKIRSDIPVILCTGFSETVTEERMDQLGIEKVLLKPIVRDDMADAIRDILDHI